MSAQKDPQVMPLRWRWGFYEKTGLDLLQIFAGLAASVLIPVAVHALSVQQEKTAEDNQRQEVLSKYYDQMSKLLIEQEELDRSNSKSDAKNIADGNAEQIPNQSTDQEREMKYRWILSMARARTLSTFRQLGQDGERRGQLLKFLYEAELIGGQCEIDEKTLQSQGCRHSILPLDGARLEGLAFDSAIQLTGVNLEGASLAKAKLPGIDLTSAIMTKARLQNANLAKALLDNAQMAVSNLEGANLSNASLVKANLKTANLKGANLSGANLQDANLEGADLRDADLRGADLTGASLKDAKFDGAVYNTDNKETKFPSEFDRNREEMVLKS